MLLKSARAMLLKSAKAMLLKSARAMLLKSARAILRSPFMSGVGGLEHVLDKTGSSTMG